MQNWLCFVALLVQPPLVQFTGRMHLPRSLRWPHSTLPRLRACLDLYERSWNGRPGKAMDRTMDHCTVVCRADFKHSNPKTCCIGVCISSLSSSCPFCFFHWQYICFLSALPWPFPCSIQYLFAPVLALLFLVVLLWNRLFDQITIA